MPEPSCCSCGRRHGTAPLVAPTNSLFWAWLDENPPQRYQRTIQFNPRWKAYYPNDETALWRDEHGGLQGPPVTALPHVREVVQLWRYLPTERWLRHFFPSADPKTFAGLYFCDRCRQALDTMGFSPECFPHVERVPLIEQAPAEQLMLLETL